MKTNHCSFWERLTVPTGFCHGHPDYEQFTNLLRAAAEIATLMEAIEEL